MHRVRIVTALASAVVIAAAGCGGDDATAQQSATDAGTDATRGLDANASDGARTSDDAGLDAGLDARAPLDAKAPTDAAMMIDASNVDAGATAIALPQFVHGAARVDTSAFPKIPIVIEVTGAADAVNVAFDGNAPIAATMTAQGRFVATVDATTLGAANHAMVVTASSLGHTNAQAQATLAVGADSFQFTSFAQAGPAYNTHLASDPTGDDLAVTWMSAPSGGKHQLSLQHLDGAMNKLIANDVVLNDPADEPLSGYTALMGDAIGVVYRVAKPSDSHWLVKMRVVDHTGAVKVPTMDLTNGEAAFSMAQAAADAHGFSAAWLHISPPGDAGALPPVEVRYARWDTAQAKLVGPLTLDMDQPQAAGSTQGTQSLEPLAELGIACNMQVCLVSYVRDVYDALVDLNVAKLFVATIDLGTGKLTGAPQPIEATDWDSQLFGHHLVALADGTFVLVYEATDTAAAVNPKSPCDMTLERDLLFAARFDATGAATGAPAPIFDDEGTREYPRIAPHPSGWALFWEDQRSECNANGHIGMAMNVASPDLAKLLDPYIEAPRSIGLPPEDPTLAVTGTSFVAAWSDDRHGGGLAMPEPELYFETYWRGP